MNSNEQSDKILSLSVNTYGGQQPRLFDYTATADQPTPIGSLVRVRLRGKDSLGVVRQIRSEVDPSKKLLSIEAVLELPPLPSSFLELCDWLAGYYAATDKTVWTTALPSGLRAKLRTKIVPTTDSTAVKLPFELTQNQRQIADQITASDKQFFLLHGVTGSGKTEIYLSLMAQVVARGDSVLLLVPEIILTPQIIERVSEVFGQRVLAYHSKLTAAVRKAVWTAVLSSVEPLIVIGTRSSLFLPFRKLGLIVLDEEHEPSYKQESNPRYHARDVAAKLAHVHSTKMILCSATPSLTSYYLATRGKMELLSLNERYGSSIMPAVKIVDLAKKSELLSPELESAIKQTLAQKRQVILFINRRGSAAALLCTNCGNATRCPRCETSLTFHADLVRLLCHYCGYSQVPPAVCPVCQSIKLSYIGHGTKKLESEIISKFKNYHVVRIDSDNATYEHIKDTLAKLQQRQIDILIGTQMISRGLDFAGIGLVGVVLADSILNIADFSSTERTFELLTQVAGRAGRGDQPAEAIIQTFAADNYAIMAAANHDYRTFYEQELATRAKYVYPPFCYLLKLSYGHRDPSRAKQTTAAAAEKMRIDHPDLVVLGPVEAYIKRQAGRFVYNVIVKAKNRTTLAELGRSLGEGWTIDLDPIQLL